MKPKTVRLLGENKRKSFMILNYTEIFRTLESQIIKDKHYKLNFIKICNFVSSKDTVKKMIEANPK